MAKRIKPNGELTKFVALNDVNREQTYRVTFTVCNTDYQEVLQEIQGYGDVLVEEMEVIDHE